MNDHDKTKPQLIAELAALRIEVAALKAEHKNRKVFTVEEAFAARQYTIFIAG